MFLKLLRVLEYFNKKKIVISKILKKIFKGIFMLERIVIKSF